MASAEEDSENEADVNGCDDDDDDDGGVVDDDVDDDD